MRLMLYLFVTTLFLIGFMSARAPEALAQGKNSVQRSAIHELAVNAISVPDVIQLEIGAESELSLFEKDLIDQLQSPPRWVPGMTPGELLGKVFSYPMKNWWQRSRWRKLLQIDQAESLKESLVPSMEVGFPELNGKFQVQVVPWSRSASLRFDGLFSAALKYHLLDGESHDLALVGNLPPRLLFDSFSLVGHEIEGAFSWGENKAFAALGWLGLKRTPTLDFARF